MSKNDWKETYVSQFVRFDRIEMNVMCWTWVINWKCWWLTQTTIFLDSVRFFFYEIKGNERRKTNEWKRNKIIHMFVRVMSCLTLNTIVLNFLLFLFIRSFFYIQMSDLFRLKCKVYGVWYSFPLLLERRWKNFNESAEMQSIRFVWCNHFGFSFIFICSIGILCVGIFLTKRCYWTHQMFICKLFHSIILRMFGAKIYF